MDELLHQHVMAVKQALHATPEYQKYVRLKAFIDQHPEYVAREAELKLLQKDMVQTLNDQLYDHYQAIKKEYEEKKEAFENDPAVVEYQYAKEDLNDVLIEIAKLIEQAINR